LPDIELDGPGSALRPLIESAWSAKAATPEQRWRQLKQTVRGALDAARDRSARVGGAQKMKTADRITLEKLIPSIIFTFTYPRLDVNVSKQRNHLLKGAKRNNALPCFQLKLKGAHWNSVFCSSVLHPSKNWAGLRAASS
jgi:hypothetical protein